MKLVRSDGRSKLDRSNGTLELDRSWSYTGHDLLVRSNHAMGCAGEADVRAVKGRASSAYSATMCRHVYFGHIGVRP